MPEASLRRISTRDVPPERRIAYWEETSRKTLIGLRCSSFSGEGLVAEQRNLKLDELSVTEIRGNQHVIERTPALIDAAPKDALFACLLLESDAFFYQGPQCIGVRPGELILYHTDTPYLYGFPGAMRQILVDIPRALFPPCLDAEALGSPIKVSPDSAGDRLLLRTLRTRIDRALAHPEEAEQTLKEDLRTLLSAVLQPNRRFSTALGASYLLLAQQFIDDHLHDPHLDGQRVAAAAGISLRHLNRLFARQGLSIARAITTRRLERARAMLGNARTSHMSIAEIAYRCGFSSQAHFSRLYKSRFGLTAGETRRRDPA